MILTVFKRRKSGKGESLVSMQEVFGVSCDERVPIELGSDNATSIRKVKDGMARGGFFALKVTTAANVQARAYSVDDAIIAEEGMRATLSSEDGRELAQFETGVCGRPLWQVVSYSTSGGGLSFIGAGDN